jgi:hypothetical protein
VTKILGLSGRKQSGKNTTANFILGMELKAAGFVRDHFIIQRDGRLWVSDMFGGDTDFEGYLDVTRRNNTMKAFVNDQIGPYVKLYSCADCLKEICIDVLGVGEKQCYGTDDDKNSLTNLKWEDMPGVITPDKLEEYIVSDGSGTDVDILRYVEKGKWHDFIVRKNGNMTGREVLQFVGTEIFRRMKDNVWIEATMNKIIRDGPSVAIITDIRFPNEVKGVQDRGGKVIRFTRAPFKEDMHPSECSLDEDRYDWNNFDFVIDNSDMDIPQQCDAVYDILEQIGWIPKRLEPSEVDK